LSIGTGLPGTIGELAIRISPACDVMKRAET